MTRRRRVELRARWPLLRLCAAVAPRTEAAPVPKIWAASPLSWCALATVLLVAAGAALFGTVALLAAPVVLFAVIAGRVLVLIFGAAWYAYGAGRPVLVLDGEEVRGRLRPVWADERGDPADPAWWDLRLPASDLAGVRVANPDGPAGRRMLALEVPAEVVDALAGAAPAVAQAAASRQRVAGTPAAWPVNGLLPRRRRAARLRALVAAFEQARMA
jgi:hypothetical protein